MLLPLLLLAATGAAQAPSAPPANQRGGGRLFVSPMGEPFRPARDGNGLAEWFAQADTNHDGRLTLVEMQADADRFFAVLDVNHDGEIDPDEIEHYETVILPEISGVSEETESRFGLLGIREPVTSADTNFNRGVSREEFRHAAEQRFAGLDIDHQGYLTVAGLQAIRPAKPPPPKMDPSTLGPPPEDDPDSMVPG